MVYDAAEVVYEDRVVDAVYWCVDPVEAIGGKGVVEGMHKRWRVGGDGGWRDGEGLELVGVGV